MVGFGHSVLLFGVFSAGLGLGFGEVIAAVEEGLEGTVWVMLVVLDGGGLAVVGDPFLGGPFLKHCLLWLGTASEEAIQRARTRIGRYSMAAVTLTGESGIASFSNYNVLLMRAHREAQRSEREQYLLKGQY